MADGSRQLPSKHHVKFREAEYERVAFVDEHDIDGIAKRVGQATEIQRFTYGVRICPEPVQWGGLSGCTYSEGISWGKFVSPSEGGRFAEVPCDATIVWPLIVKAVQERLAIETLRSAQVA